MNRRRFLALLAITLPLVLLWAWRGQVGERRRAEMELFLAYMDGPLNDYAFSVTRPLPESRQYAQRSTEALKKLAAGAAPGWGRERLEALLPLHQERRTASIIAILEEIRLKALESWKLPKSRYLELNALIYSLKEAQAGTGP